MEVPALGHRFDLTLGVVSHVPHYLDACGAPWAYEPYVREMDVWARLFARVNVCAPVAEWARRGNLSRYSTSNVRWTPIRFSNWPGPRRHFLRAWQLGGVRRSLASLMATSDLVLLRSPGTLSMVARAMAARRRTRTITKWAGPLRPSRGDAPSTRLERVQMERGTAPALVYGRSSRPHLISFIPALMSAAELHRAATLGAARVWAPPWQILAVGRLSPEKGFDLALRGVAELARRQPDLDWRFTVVGDGRRRAALQALADRLGLGQRVHFAGARSFSDVQGYFSRAHAVVMPSKAEGWPKTIAEAWAHGAVPVAAGRGIVPEIVGDAGMVFEPTVEGLARALGQLLSTPAMMQRMSRGGPARCDELSLETFEQRLERVLVDVVGLR